VVQSGNRSAGDAITLVRLHILSDLHAEFAAFTPPSTDADVVVIAGDVHIGRQGRAWIRANFPDKPVIYVLGNHEFYRQALPELTETLRRETEGSHIHILENDAVEIDGFSFLGCTLWTDFQLTGDPVVAGLAGEAAMSDYQLIRLSPQYRKLRSHDTAKLHLESLNWLKHEIASRDPKRVVIVTHHAPSQKSIPPSYAGNVLNAAFASDLETLIIESGVALWIHGHTHHCVDYHLGDTRILSNQRGYPDALVEGFNPTMVVEVPAQKVLET
jgi:predicted phosphodiesterase